MKFTETFCKPSSSVTIVPIGLPVILQYNEHGLLQKVLVGYGNNLKKVQETYPIDANIYDKFFAGVKKIAPQSISTKGGTTWVYAVMYTDRVPCDEGKLPEALFDSYIKDIADNGMYKLYAGHVYSLASSFRGPLIVRNFLSASKFELLPQVIVPTRMTDATIDAAMQSTKAQFHKDYIAGFFIFEQLECRYLSANMFQFTCTNNPEIHIKEDGTWKGTVVTKSGTELEYPYSLILHHQISKNTSFIVHSSNVVGDYEIIATRMNQDAELVLGAVQEVKCPVCRKVCKLGFNDNEYKCDDPFCLSHQYPQVEKMITVFELPELTYEEYKHIVKNEEIVCLSDILELPRYSEHKVTTTLANALFAATQNIPFSLLERFANKCNNDVDSVKYYLDNPLRIETDLDMVNPEVARFAKWLESPYNVSTITSILELVNIEKMTKKFDGDPIFRGNIIAITGKFKRGSLPEIESILRSYAAEVTTTIERGDKLPHVIITGSTNENISGAIIQKARTHNIPIIEEDEFFVKYEIDEDLQRNLL